MNRYALAVALATTFNPIGHAQNTSTVPGNKNQTAGTNNGVMNQFNITVTPSVTQSLKRHAQEDFGTERGWLRTIVPANDKLADDKSCVVPEGNLTVLLGEHGSKGSCAGDHCGILSDPNPRAVNTDILSVDRKGQSLQINAVLFDESGKVIAVINSNRTHVNPSVAFDWERPDDHTIDVTDQYNRHVLHVRFANAHTIVVTGIFRFSDGRIVTVTNDKMVDQFNNTFSGECSINARRSAFAF